MWEMADHYVSAEEIVSFIEEMHWAIVDSSLNKLLENTKLFPKTIVCQKRLLAWL